MNAADVDDFVSDSDSRPPAVEPVVPDAAPEPEKAAAAALETADTDTDEDAAADGADPASEAGKALSRKRGALQRRVDQAIARQRDAERRAEDAERLLREREAARTVEERKPAAPAYVTRPRPQEAEIGTKYETYDAYIEDLTDWKTDEKLARQQQASAAERATRAQQDAFAQHGTRLEAFKQSHADFDALAEESDVRVPQPMVDAILQSEHGPAMQYHLLQHPDEARRIAALSPGRQLYEMGKIEARVTAATSGPVVTAPKVTKAHAPIKPVGGGSVAADDGPPSDDSDLDAHVEYYNRKERDTRRSR